MSNADEWKYFKSVNNLKTPLERDLFHFEDTGEISLFMTAMESIHIPFKYDSFDFGTFSQDPIEIKVFFIMKV